MQAGEVNVCDCSMTEQLDSWHQKEVNVYGSMILDCVPTCRVCSVSSQVVAVCSNGLMNGDARMDWILTI